MARRKNTVVRYSRDYRRPPKWNMGLPPRRNRLADPRTYLSAAVVLASVGLVVLPAVADGYIALARPTSETGGSCRIYQVVDGDTVRMWCPGRGSVKARLVGFDTPELYSPQCPSEFAAAVRATWALRLALLRAGAVRLVREGTDRYGRALVAAFVDGAPLARAMIADGHARAYAGGQRQGWCA
ncbi:MAG: thermonuclease family protein [Paracoccaceae bacterium]